MLHDLNVYIVGRLLLAAVLGGVVGLERELSHKPSGIRTNMLICLGAALFTIVSYQMAAAFGGDHTRIAAQIIPGIGFLGAGVVIRERGTIIGITSAATIFVVASIGMAVGADLYVTAIFVTLLLLASLVVIGNVEHRVGFHARVMSFSITTVVEPSTAARIRQVVEETGSRTRRWQTRGAEGGVLVEFEVEANASQERDLARRLGALHLHFESHLAPPVTAL
jgi:putative Mg2+ transporter-C (MgtC) family protein